MEKSEPLYIINPDEAKIHLSKGNSKIGKGIWSWSTLPGNSEHLLTLSSGKTAVILTDIPGTCSKHCESCFDHGCYAVNSAKLHHNAVIRAWAENTILLRSGRAFHMIDEFITKKNAKFLKSKNPEDLVVRTFRINVSGEIESAEEFHRWDMLAANHPEVTFSVYTKNFEALEDFLETSMTFAENFVINISQWHHCADEFLAAHPGLFNVFEYDDSNREDNDLSEEDISRLAGMIHCPAVTRSGKHAKTPSGEDITCDHCLRCYRKSSGRTAVYSH